MKSDADPQHHKFTPSGRDDRRQHHLVCQFCRVQDTKSLTRCFPGLDLLLHRLEIPLDPIDPDRKDVDEAEVFGVLCEDRTEHAWDNVANYECELSARGTLSLTRQHTSGQ